MQRLATSEAIDPAPAATRVASSSVNVPGAFNEAPLNLELLAILTGALSPGNIRSFNKTLLEQEEEEFLRPQTLAKSFTMLLAGVRLVCGGPFLSETQGFTRFCANESVRTLQDIATAWNRKASLDKNKAEAFRLRNSLYQSPAREMLSALFFFCTLVKGFSSNLCLKWGRQTCKYI